MARRTGVLQAVAKAQREAERRRAAEIRAQTQAARAAEQARRAYERAIAADQRERARLYVESRVAEVELQNEQLQQRLDDLSHILSATLGVDDFFDLDQMKEVIEVPAFDPGDLGKEEPAPNQTDYQPVTPSGLRKFMPGAKENHARLVVENDERYRADMAAHRERERERLAALASARAEHDRSSEELRQKAAAQHAEVDQLKVSLAAGDPDAIVQYLSLVLGASSYPGGFPQHAKVAYVPESKQAVIEYDLPPFDVIPDASMWKYSKSKDEVTPTARSAGQRRSMYSSAIAQVTIRTLHEVFEADRLRHVESVVFNGYVDSIDSGTGRAVRPCLVTVRTTRETFEQLDLARVDPVACLKTLNASVSKSPTELTPVRPVLEFSMVDPRFIEETDVLSTLDQRPNLMELSPTEFEALISNLFQTMGIETRLTQASRDGGVDCVAYDPRPIFGGKVVIQAKRYKDTVGVSAVRDLFGTVQNEGASKGILVTTSGFGQSAYEFAEGKPLELLSGSHLLHLLAEHAGIEARIVMPEA